MGLIVQCMRLVFNSRKSITPPPISKQPDHLNVETYHTLIDSFKNAINQPDPEGKIVKLAKELIAIYFESSRNKVKIFPFNPNIQEKLVADITKVFAENKDKVQDITGFFKSLKDYLNIKSQKNPDVTISKFLIIVEDLLTIFYNNTLIDYFTRSRKHDPEGKIVKLAKKLILIYCESSRNKLKSIFDPKIKSDLVTKITEVFTENKNESQDITSQDIIRFFEHLKGYLNFITDDLFTKNKNESQDITRFFEHCLMIEFQENNVEFPKKTISQFLIIVKDLLTIFQDVNVIKMETGEPVLLNAENSKEKLSNYYHGWI